MNKCGTIWPSAMLSQSVTGGTEHMLSKCPGFGETSNWSYKEHCEVGPRYSPVLCIQRTELWQGSEWGSCPVLFCCWREAMASSINVWFLSVSSNDHVRCWLSLVLLDLVRSWGHPTPCRAKPLFVFYWSWNELEIPPTSTQGLAPVCSQQDVFKNLSSMNKAVQL